MCDTDVLKLKAALLFAAEWEEQAKREDHPKIVAHLAAQAARYRRVADRLADAILPGATTEGSWCRVPYPGPAPYHAASPEQLLEIAMQRAERGRE